MVVRAEKDGTILTMDAMKVGMAAWKLGAGRTRQGESVQAGAGIEIHAKPGELVKAGSPLFTLHSDVAGTFVRAVETLQDSVEIGELPEGGIDRLPLVIERIV
jgi:thymidine phosphorylase